MEGGRGGGRGGLQPRARGPVRGGSGGTGSAPPRAPPPRVPCKRQRQRQHQQQRQQPRAASGGAGWTDRLTEGSGGAWPARAGHGGILIRRGPRGSCSGPRELRAAAPDPAEGRVLGECLPPPPAPSLSRLTSLVPLPCPSPPSSSSPAPPPPAAGWGDVTWQGAPTCGPGRGRRRQLGTLRGHRPSSPIPNSSLGLTALFLSLRSVFPVLTT